MGTRPQPPGTPFGAAIETRLLLADVIRPQAVPAVAAAGLDGDETLGESLVRYTTTGFRPAPAAQADLEIAGSQALALLNDGKPELAAPLLEAALNHAAAAGADRHAIACMELNLASAFVQIGDPAKAVDVAAQAAETFKASEDPSASLRRSTPTA